jgi:hypothetical protein
MWKKCHISETVPFTFTIPRASNLKKFHSLCIVSDIQWYGAVENFPFPSFRFTDKKNSVACSPQANYTDRATAACRRSFCQLLRIEGVACSAQRIPTAVNLGFPDRRRYSLEIAPQLSSRGWVDPDPDTLLLRKCGSAGNRTRDLCICSQELWKLDHSGGLSFST